ncbi:MAG: hypothetical protein V1886_02400 [archaeon]
MAMKSCCRAFLSSMCGFLVMIILLLLSNVLVSQVNNPLFTGIVLFFNSNIALLTVIFLLFLAGEIFSLFIFPFNLPYPIFSAIGGMFLLTFMFRMFALADNMAGTEMFAFLETLALFLYPLLFFIILASGYGMIFSRLLRGEDNKAEKKIKKAFSRGKGKNWDEISSEFRNLLYDIAASLRKSLGQTGKRRKKRKH